MRLRQLVLACGLTSFVLSPYASALGLGEVKLKSSLNQPLEAEVKLLDTRDLTAEQILVTLASPADFERNGVERLYFYSELQFQVELESPDGPKVIIKSRNPVREPYLNFLIEARWTAGRLLREYTLLMDLPTFEEGASATSVNTPVAPSPVAQPRVTTSAPRAASSGSPTAVAASPAPASRQPSLSGDEYEVRANDTLWEIALRARPDSSVSVHQSMMALYRANPEAFINGNINKLRRGQVLRVPDADEMKSVNKTAALDQFAQATGDSDLGAQLNASRRVVSGRAESTEVSGRVKLAAPSAGAGRSGQGSGANDGAGKALESELAATLEELDKSKSENTELGVRVKDLEAQIETMERLVAVSNEKLRALQVAAGETVAAVESSAAQSLQASSVDALAAAPAEAQAAASSLAAAQPPQPTPPKPQKVIQPPVAEPALADTLADNALWIALGVLGVAGGAGALLAYRRRKTAEEHGSSEPEDVFAMDDMTEDQSLSEMGEEAAPDLADSSLFEEESETTAVAETGDVVGEADIYIAYGKLDQAEEMLLNGLQKDPESTDIRMKLLEVYAQQQNPSAFDKHYSALLPIAGAALLARAAELRAGLDGADAFVEAAPVAESSAADDLDDFNFDDFKLDDDEPLAAEVAEVNVAPAVETADDFNFDFDLDLDDAAAESAPLSAEAQPATDDEFEFELEDADKPIAGGDDLSELSLALDDLDRETLPVEIDANAPLAEEEFSFDFDDDLELPESVLGAESPVESLLAEEAGQLDVVADDFNLDMNVDDVDLAALDHEMESLDVDFDDELLSEHESSVAEFASTEIAKDEQEIGLDLDDETLPLHSEADLGLLEDDLSSTKLVLTDDLDKPLAGAEFELDDGLSDFDLAAVNTGEQAVAESSADMMEDDFLLDMEGDSLEALDAELELAGLDTASMTSAEHELNELSDLMAPELELSDDEFDLAGDAVDFDALNDELSLLDEQSAPAVDLALDDLNEALELPEDMMALAEAGDALPDESLLAEAAELSLPESINDLSLDGAEAESEAELDEVHGEDLFAAALSDFGGTADEIDLNSFTSDEAALADLSDEDMDSELDFLADADEAATKLDLARAYIDMGDADGAKDILAEVVAEGSEQQRQEANELLGRLV